jgi:glycosyltransferase involved in cell wall biosynthesis
VGKGTPGILKELRKMMRDLKIEDKVAFPFEPTRGASYGTELVSVLTDSRMMIYPSKMDTAPMSIMDSLACGLPVIAYDIPGVRETYGKCDAVILVPPGDIAALTRETISLLKDDVRWSQLKEKAIAFCRQKSWDKVALAERGFYVRVIHQLRNRSSRPPHQQD